MIREELLVEGELLVQEQFLVDKEQLFGAPPGLEWIFHHNSLNKPSARCHRTSQLNYAVLKFSAIKNSSF